MKITTFSVFFSIIILLVLRFFFSVKKFIFEKSKTKNLYLREEIFPKQEKKAHQLERHLRIKDQKNQTSKSIKRDIEKNIV
jgi:uncharacterized membrane protein YhiD involved in acid resistance